MNEDKAHELVSSWEKKFPKERFVVRGQSKLYKRVSSTLYRQLGTEATAHEMLEQEREMVAAIRQRIPPFITDVEILSDLQHFGGPTNCIDFTSDINVALFFACADDEKCGELIFVPYDRLRLTSAVDFLLPNKKHEPTKMELVIPSPTDMDKNRALFQRSLFIRSHQGFINPADKCVQIVEKNQKAALSSYIARRRVSHLLLFKDIFGSMNFEMRSAETPAESSQADGAGGEASSLPAPISVPDSADSSYTRYDSGVLNYCRGNYQEALEDFDELIFGGKRGNKLYRFRGSTYYSKGDYEKAVQDINSAGQSSWNDRDCFLLAMSYYKMGRFNCALSSIRTAIDFNPYRPIYHHLRIMLENLRMGRGRLGPSVPSYLEHFEKHPDVERIIEEKIMAENRPLDWERDEIG